MDAQGPLRRGGRAPVHADPASCCGQSLIRKPCRKATLRRNIEPHIPSPERPEDLRDQGFRVGLGWGDHRADDLAMAKRAQGGIACQPAVRPCHHHLAMAQDLLQHPAPVHACTGMVKRGDLVQHRDISPFRPCQPLVFCSDDPLVLGYLAVFGKAHFPVEWKARLCRDQSQGTVLACRQFRQCGLHDPTTQAKPPMPAIHNDHGGCRHRAEIAGKGRRHQGFAVKQGHAARQSGQHAPVFGAMGPLLCLRQSVRSCNMRRFERCQIVASRSHRKTLFRGAWPAGW